MAQTFYGDLKNVCYCYKQVERIKQSQKCKWFFSDKMQSSQILNNFLSECDFNYQMHHTKEQFELYFGTLC